MTWRGFQEGARAFLFWLIFLRSVDEPTTSLPRVTQMVSTFSAEAVNQMQAGGV